MDLEFSFKILFRIVTKSSPTLVSLRKQNHLLKFITHCRVNILTSFMSPLRNLASCVESRTVFSGIPTQDQDEVLMTSMTCFTRTMTITTTHDIREMCAMFPSLWRLLLYWTKPWYDGKTKNISAFTLNILV